MTHCFGRLFWYLEKGDGSMALWGGRFEAGVAEVTQEFGASLPVDKHLYKQDIAGSKAHAKMLAAQGIISAEDEQTIAKGLTGIEQDIDAGNFTFDINDEDIHMSIESELTRRIGEATDIANAVMFLASTRSDFTTGAEIMVDGGFSNMMGDLTAKPGGRRAYADNYLKNKGVELWSDESGVAKPTDQ